MAKDGKKAFPKIAADVKIKKVVMCDKAQLTFEDLEFSPEQYAQLERWRQYKDPLRLTLAQIQANINDQS